MSESQDLFNEFETISDQEWRDKVITDIKGKDFDETLVWTDENKIQHLPYYRKSNTDKIELLKEIQSSQEKPKSWKIVQSFKSNADDLKHLVQEAFEGGADEVVIADVVNTKSTSKKLGSQLQDSKKVHFEIKNLANNSLSKRYFCDPIGEMVANGAKNEQDLEALRGIFQKRLNQLKPDNFLLIDSAQYKNAGATTVEELAYSLHHAVEYLDILSDSGYTPEAVARSFTFKIGISTSYFTEIAKLRAFRFLIRQIFAAYNVKAKVRIWAEASTYYHSHKDAHTNLLRLSTQCMSAVIGNCDLLSLAAFDEHEKGSTLGYRMSRNIPLILKNESYFDQVQDMAAGSYYIENLTAELVEASNALFQSIEKDGGLLKQVENQSLKQAIEKSKNERLLNFKEKGKAMIGVNKYENEEGTELSVHLKESKGLSSSVLSKELTH